MNIFGRVNIEAEIYGQPSDGSILTNLSSEHISIQRQAKITQKNWNRPLMVRQSISDDGVNKFVAWFH